MNVKKRNIKQASAFVYFWYGWSVILDTLCAHTYIFIFSPSTSIVGSNQFQRSGWIRQIERLQFPARRHNHTRRFFLCEERDKKRNDAWNHTKKGQRWHSVNVPQGTLREKKKGNKISLPSLFSLSLSLPSFQRRVKTFLIITDYFVQRQLTFLFFFLLSSYKS